MTESKKEMKKNANRCWQLQTKSRVFRVSARRVVFKIEDVRDGMKSHMVPGGNKMILTNNGLTQMTENYYHHKYLKNNLCINPSQGRLISTFNAIIIIIKACIYKQ